MIEAFKASPLLLLFVVSALGYAVGNISIRGAKLGAAAVLFVGLAFGALDPALSVPEIIIVLGLAIFVYTIGLSSGPGFFNTFKRHGLQNTFFIVAILSLSALISVGLFFLMDLEAATAAGLFAGSNTNTPALAGLLDLISKSPEVALRNQLSNSGVIGYSLSYPMGVLGAMLAIFLCKRWLGVNYSAEEKRLQHTYPVKENLTRWSVEVTKPEMVGRPIRDLFQQFSRRIVFGRMLRKEQPFLPNMDTILQLGDQIVIVGSREILEGAAQVLGKKLDTEISLDRTVFDAQRVFVSNPEVAGEKIASLNLPEKYSTIITRVQRGDMDILATGDTVLELGDRVLLLTRRKDLPKVSAIFGNSYEALSHINLLSFGSGMALGLLLGMVNFELPGGLTFNLGFAGGPLLVGLLLGALRRSGPVVWTLPYSANLTLRQIGLILLLAGIGIRSGHTFLETLLQGEGWVLFLASASISFIPAMIALAIGYRFLKIPFSLLTGMISNQPAVLEYSMDLAKNKLPTVGFTMVLPVVMIAKILLAQLIFAWLQNL